MSEKSEAVVIAVDGHDVRISHPDKPYFTRDVKLSKLDVVHYFLSVAPGALGGIRDRPIVLKRFVDGAERRALLSEARAASSCLIGCAPSRFRSPRAGLRKRWSSTIPRVSPGS